MYTVQNKVLPGAYINFVSAARASATLGDRGTAAFPLSLDWGPENEVVTIENSEFQKGSLALTGYAYTADELRPLREIFANAKTLHLFRLNSGGAKAACKMCIRDRHTRLLLRRYMTRIWIFSWLFRVRPAEICVVSTQSKRKSFSRENRVSLLTERRATPYG